MRGDLRGFGFGLYVGEYGRARGASGRRTGSWGSDRRRQRRHGGAYGVAHCVRFHRLQLGDSSQSCSGDPEVFDGVPSLLVKEGSNAYWAVVQVRNPMAAVTAIDWAKQGDAVTKGTLAYAAPSIENYWTVPVDVLQSNATYGFTVHYSDGSMGTVTLTSAQLAQAGTGYALK